MAITACVIPPESSFQQWKSENDRVPAQLEIFPQWGPTLKATTSYCAYQVNLHLNVVKLYNYWNRIKFLIILSLNSLRKKFCNLMKLVWR